MENIKKILRVTKSVCPVCLEMIDASLTENGCKIFLDKTCPAHGETSILVSQSRDYYKELEDFHFRIMVGVNRSRDVELLVSSQCNIDCPVCGFHDCGKKAVEEGPTLQAIERYVATAPKNFYILTGGEPTCRPDLTDVIRLLKRRGKIVCVNSNGIRLADKEYLSSLKKAGLDRVNIQIDSLSDEVERRLRGGDHLRFKMAALENLREEKISTAIHSVIVRGVNEGQLSNVIDFAVRSGFVSTVNFITVMMSGRAKSFGVDNYIMPDELIDLLSQQTRGKFSRKNFLLFQKLHLMIKSFFSQKFCFYFQSYVVVRTKDGYEPIDRYLSFRYMGRWLNRSNRAFTKNKVLSLAYLIIAMASLFTSWKSFLILKDFMSTGLSYFLHSSHYLNRPRFIFINLVTECDPYKFDLSLTQQCHCDSICINSETNALKYPECSASFYIYREGAFCRSGAGAKS